MNASLGRDLLRQRTDYTYKFNTKTGRHGWLRLTPAYSVKIVEELISDYKQAKRILDPFCGTGTTALSAAYHGHEGVTTDINPFLIWLAQAKVDYYSTGDIARTDKASALVLDLIHRQAITPVLPPLLYNLDRWWNPKELDFLCHLKPAIEEATNEDSVERTLLFIAFCRSLIKFSNASFNHQSMSFKTGNQPELSFEIDLANAYYQDVQFVLKGAAENPQGVGHILSGDSRNLRDSVSGVFDLVITSPPYANRMSYIRELRPYMYWLEFLKNGRDAGELDWTAIGGTWGIATSRLASWDRPKERFKSSLLDSVLDRIAHSNNKNGDLLANYVAKYFDDMWSHFQSLTSVLTTGAEVHYIVGNSTFYNILVSTEVIYSEMLITLGFDSVECRPIRKRNSKKELVEFDVAARWAP